MKNTIVLTIALGVSLFAASQNVKMNGEIKNPKGNSVYLFIPNMDRTTTFLDSAMVDENGKFQLEATLEDISQVFFSDGNENAQLVLSPGDDITVSLNTRFFDETISFSGKGAKKNTAVMSLYMLNESIAQSLFSSMEKEDTTAVIQGFTDAYNEYLLLVNDYKAMYPELAEYLGGIQTKAEEYKKGMINYYRTERAFKTFVASLKGQQINDFKGVDLNGDAINLSAFKGKLTVLDFWATWCGPCRAEFPAYKELEATYGEEINFVSVGVYCKEEDWKKMATNEGFNNNIFLSKEVQDQIKDLRVDFIPRYIVLDEQHKIIDGQAPRPSSGRLQNYWKK